MKKYIGVEDECRNDGAQLAAITSKEEFDWMVANYVGKWSNAYINTVRSKCQVLLSSRRGNDAALFLRFAGGGWRYVIYAYVTNISWCLLTLELTVKGGGCQGGGCAGKKLNYVNDQLGTSMANPAWTQVVIRTNGLEYCTHVNKDNKRVGSTKLIIVPPIIICPAFFQSPRFTQISGVPATAGASLAGSASGPAATAPAARLRA